MISEVLHSYHLHLQHLNRLVADLTGEQMVAQPNGVLNHPAWTLGHLIHSCEAIGGELGLQPWLPSEWHTLFGTGSVPAADVSKYADKHALLAALEDGRTRLQRRLVTMTDNDLSAPLPDVRFRNRFPTIGHAVIHILCGHTALHLGQLTVWRRAMELDLPSEPSSDA